jgi:hypothetical protein
VSTPVSDSRFDRSLTMVIGLWCSWLAWRLSSPVWLTAINWDQGAYIAKAVAPGGHWSDAPWNAHYAIGHVYEMGVFVARLFGGTVIDGYRLMTAVSFGLTGGLVADAGRRLSGDRWFGALCALGCATAWVNLLFLLILEDNVLYLPAAAGIFWLVVARRESWGRRENLCAGALAGWAALQSWQALYYLGPAGYAALLFTPGPKQARLRAGAEVVAAFFGTLIGWMVLISVTSSLDFVDLWRSMFSRPTGSFTLSEPSLDFWGRVTGLGAGWMATHTFVDYPPLPFDVRMLGWLVLALLGGILYAAARTARRHRRWDLHLIALSLFLFTLVTPLYHDFTEWRYLVRFDFWPLLLALLAAAIYQPAERWLGMRPLFVVSLTMVIVWNGVRAAEYSHTAKKRHPTLETWTQLPHKNKESFYGRDGMSWFQFFRGIREAAPGACRYVFAWGELNEGGWNPDIPGSLFSELGAPVFAVGDPKTVGGSRYHQPQVVSPKEAEKLAADKCAWISRDASRLLGWRY